MAVCATCCETDIAHSKDGTERPNVKSNECRCIYEMQASVYSNNFSQWGTSLQSTLCIDRSSVKHISSLTLSQRPSAKHWLITPSQFCTNLQQHFHFCLQFSKDVEDKCVCAIVVRLCAFVYACRSVHPDEDTSRLNDVSA